ncbi:hypothetical protein CWO90_33140 [Bradyrhizobium sp. Leo121]|nr:hypothetical protein CWO90_33140 [Bradyrhizobium sp. Leo121]
MQRSWQIDAKGTLRRFLDLVLLPMLFRSLLGESPKDLKTELSGCVRERVGFFLAACETDWGALASSRRT